MIAGPTVFRFARTALHPGRVPVRYEDADGRNYTYAGSFPGRGQYTLPWGSTRLKYDFDLHQRHYHARQHAAAAVNPGTQEREDSSRTTCSDRSSAGKNLGPTSIGCARPRPCRSRSPPSTSGGRGLPTAVFAFNGTSGPLTLVLAVLSGEGVTRPLLDLRAAVPRSRRALSRCSGCCRSGSGWVGEP